MGLDNSVLGKEYRLSKGILAIGLLTTPFFAAMGVFGVLVSVLDDSSPHPVAAALLFGCFWGSWTVLGLWVILAYLRERVIVGSGCFQIVDCFQTRTADVAAISRAIWKSRPNGGMLLMFTRVGKMKIYFGNYEPTDRAELIRYFRRTVPADRQENWTAFESSSA